MAPPTCDVMTGCPEPSKAVSLALQQGKNCQKYRSECFFNEIPTVVGKLMVEYYAKLL